MNVDDQRMRDLEEKVTKLLAHMETLMRRFGQHEENQEKFRDQVQADLHGTDGGVGLKTRVDRLEQSSARATRFLWLVASVAVAGAAKWIMG